MPNTKFNLLLKSAPGSDNGRRFVVSTDTVDRMGDVLRQDWDISHFQNAGAPALLNHDPNQIVGSWSDLAVENGQLSATFQPAAPGTSPVADAAAKLVEQGLLAGASVGLLAHEMEPIDGGGVELSGLELMEISLTPTPANREAVAVARAFNLSDDQTRLLMEAKQTAPNNQPLNQPQNQPIQLHRDTPPGDGQPAVRRVPAPAVHTTPDRPYSIARAIQGLLQMPGRPDDGLEREVADEIAQRTPRKTWSGMPIPFKAIFPSMIRKANAGAPGGTGNPLTGTDYLDELLSIQGNAMPKEMLAGRLGVQTVQTNELVAQLPQVTGKVSASTVALDSVIPTSDFATANVQISPVTAGARTVVERSLFYSHQGDQILRSQVAAAVGEELDTALLGPQAGQRPNGIIDIAGAATLTPVLATEESWRAFMDELLVYLAMPNADPEVIRFLIPTLVSDKLATTEAWTNSGSAAIQRFGMVAEVPVVRTHLLDVSTPTASPVLVGDFSTMIFLLFQGGAADVIANPWESTAWSKGGYELRALVDYSVHGIDAARMIQSVFDAS